MTISRAFIPTPGPTQSSWLNNQRANIAATTAQLAPAEQAAVKEELERGPVEISPMAAPADAQAVDNALEQGAAKPQVVSLRESMLNAGQTMQISNFDIELAASQDGLTISRAGQDVANIGKAPATDWVQAILRNKDGSGVIVLVCGFRSAQSQPGADESSGADSAAQAAAEAEPAVTSEESVVTD